MQMSGINKLRPSEASLSRWKQRCISVAKSAVCQHASRHPPHSLLAGTSVKRVCFLRDNTEDASQPWLNISSAGPWMLVRRRMNHTAGLHLLAERRWAVTCTHAAATCTAVQIQKTFHIKSLSFLLSLSIFFRCSTWCLRGFRKPRGRNFNEKPSTSYKGGGVLRSFTLV